MQYVYTFKSDKLQTASNSSKRDFEYMCADVQFRAWKGVGNSDISNMYPGKH